MNNSIPADLKAATKEYEKAVKAYRRQGTKVNKLARRGASYNEKVNAISTFNALEDEVKAKLAYLNNIRAHYGLEPIIYSSY